MTRITTAPAAITRRSLLAGAASLGLATKAGAAGRDPAHLRIADMVRTLAPPRHGHLRLLIPQGSAANIAPIAAAFQEMAGIPVHVIETPVRDVANALMIDGLLGDAAYDVALPATFDIPELVSANIVRSLEGFDDLRADFHEDEGILYSEGDSFDGKPYGYQTDGDAYIMFYNRRFFDDRALSDAYADAYGMPLAPAGDWDTFDRQVRFISGRDDGRKGAQLARTTGYVEWEWWLRLHARGIWPLSPQLRPQIAGADGVAALEAMVETQSSLQPEPGGLNSLFLRWQQFERGNIYAAMSWGGSQKFHLRPGGPIANDLVHTVIPGGAGADTPDSLPYFNWGWSYCVTSASPDPDLAHAFCLFAASREMSLRAVRQGEGFFDPFRNEHYDDRVIQNIYGKPFLKVHRVSMENAMPDFYVSDRADYFSALADWIGLALNGITTSEAAMQNVSEIWEAIGAKGDKEKRIAQWARLRKKYPPEIASKLRDTAPV